MIHSDVFHLFISRNMMVRGIRAIMNKSGEKESPWKIPLLMSTFPITSELMVRVVFHILVTFSRKFFTLSAAPIRSTLFKSHEGGTESYAFFSQSIPFLNFDVFFLHVSWSFYLLIGGRLSLSTFVYILFVPMVWVPFQLNGCRVHWL